MHISKSLALRILLSLVMRATLSLSVAILTAGHVTAHHSPPPPTPTPMATATATPTAPADFSLTANFQPPAVGYLAQGAIPGSTCPPLQCNGGLPEPAYLVSQLGCFYDWNTLTVFPFSNFLGTVKLTVSGLPAGVTSLMPTSVTVTQLGGLGQVNFPFELQASSTAALGSAAVTITATSGALVHSLSMPISVGTALPPLTPSCGG